MSSIIAGVVFRPTSPLALNAEDDVLATRSADEPRDVPLLPEPADAPLSSCDPGAELAMLLIESAREDRKISRAMRDAEERAQRAAEDAQLESLREAAASRFGAGLAGGVSAVASGLVSASGAGEVARASARDVELARKGPQSVGAAAGASPPKATITAPTVQYAVDAGVKMTDGAGKLLSTALQGRSDDASNEATHREQLVGRNKRAVEDAREGVRDAKSLVDRAIAFYKEYAAAKADAQRAAFLRA